MTELTDHDREAAVACATKPVIKKLDEDDLAKRLAKIAANKPDTGPGIDRPKFHMEGQMADGRRWTFEDGWCPFHGSMQANFHIYSDAAGISLYGSDRTSVREAVELIIGRALPSA